MRASRNPRPDPADPGKVSMKTDEEVHTEIRRLVSGRDVDGLASLGAGLAAERPLPARFRVAIGAALSECGEARQALEWFERIGPADKPYDFARAQMARILNRLGEHKRVIQITASDDEAALPDPLALARVRALCALRRADEAIGLVNRLDARRPAPAALLGAAADAALQSSDWSSALAFIDRALSVSHEAKLRLRRAVMLFHLDRLDECLAILNDLSVIEELSARALSYIVRVHQARGSADAALESCRRLLAADPANEFGLETIIRHHLEYQDFKAAESWFFKANELNPTRFPPEIFHFMVYERRGELKKALKPFNDGALDANLPDNLKERIGTAYYFTGQYGKAWRLSRAIDDGERSHILRVKVKLGSQPEKDVDIVSRNNETRLLKTLYFYLREQYRKCLIELESSHVLQDAELGVGNLRNLARSGKLLSNQLFAESRSVPGGAKKLPVIQQLWVGNELSYIEFLSIRSFIACGHQTHLYTYDANIKAPAGCVIKDARDILPESEIFAHSPRAGRSSGSLAGFADLFRWKLIYEKGGAWADCDVVCLEPIRSLEMVSTELARVGTLVVPAITNCFFAAKKRESAFLRAYEGDPQRHPGTDRGSRHAPARPAETDGLACEAIRLYHREFGAVDPGPLRSQAAPPAFLSLGKAERRFARRSLPSWILSLASSSLASSSSRLTRTSSSAVSILAFPPLRVFGVAGTVTNFTLHDVPRPLWRDGMRRPCSVPRREQQVLSRAGLPWRPARAAPRQPQSALESRSLIG